MNEALLTQYITDTFDDVQIQIVDGNTFFFYASERMLPFPTLMTNDDNDSASDLNRPSVFRLNIGISKTTYLSLFGPRPSPPGVAGVVDTGHDFTALDQLMPHPVYGHLFWVCVLNPNETTFQAVRPLLTEAYDLAVSKRAKRETHGSSDWRTS